MQNSEVPYQILFSKKAQKDIALLTDQQKAKLKEIMQQVLAITPQTGKRLKGNLSGFYSYRLSKRDRILYEIIEDNRTVFIIRARTHYGE